LEDGGLEAVAAVGLQWDPAPYRLSEGFHVWVGHHFERGVAAMLAAHVPDVAPACQVALVVPAVGEGGGAGGELLAESIITWEAGLFKKDLEEPARAVSELTRILDLPPAWKRIVSAPKDLREYIIALIDKEIRFHKKNKNGLIIAKMNSLEDPRVIEKLYEASKAGVKVRLIVRGICSLVPGVKDLSENIHVKSIVGRFLEHTRIFLFNNNASARVFLSSADWMKRNFDRRIELLFEIHKEEIKSHLKEILELCWKDTAKSWDLGEGRSYHKAKPRDEKFNCQEQLIKRYGG